MTCNFWICFNTTNTNINITYISEVELFSVTGGGAPVFYPIQFTTPVDHQSMVYGSINSTTLPSSVDLVCTVSNNGSFMYTWTGPDGMGIMNNNKTSIYSADTTRTSILRISQLSITDNGTYSCGVTYDHVRGEFETLPEASTTIKLHLQGSVSTPGIVLAAIGDESVDLSCIFTGYLPSTYTIIWRNSDGEVLEDSTDRYNITTSLEGPGQANIGGQSISTGVTSTLTINNVVQSDIGIQYTCEMEGTNIIGIIQLDEQQPVMISTTNLTTISMTMPPSSSITFSMAMTTTTPSTTPISSSNSDILIPVLTGTLAFILLLLFVLVCIPGPVRVWYYKWRRKRNSFSIKSRSKLESELATDDGSTAVPMQSLNLPSPAAGTLPQDHVLGTFPSSCLIESSNLKVIEKIGQGEFGVVYRGTLTKYDNNNEPTVIPVAVKTVKRIYMKSQFTDLLIDEAEKMMHFDHFNVLSLTGVCVDLFDSPCLVMPFMSNGSLLSYLRKESADLTVSESADESIILDTRKQLLSMCLQVAKGMAYLADQKFVHRDLAARNCMISSDGIIKVADFGLAEDVYSSGYFKLSSADAESLKLPLMWMALESISFHKFNEKTDVWSFGVLCWEVFTIGKVPYTGMSPKEVVRMLESGERMDKPITSTCSDETYSLMLSCWDELPDKRPCFTDIVANIEILLIPLAKYMDFTEHYI